MANQKEKRSWDPYGNEKDGSTIPLVYKFLNAPSKTVPGAVPVLSIENNDPDKLAKISVKQMLDNYFMETDEENPYYSSQLISKTARTLIFTGASKTKWGQMQELADKMANGPYYMDGRDGNMHLHNKMINRPISHVYTYFGGNGELLKFTISSKFTLNYAEVSQSTDINGDTKEGETVISQNASNPDPGLYVFEPKKLGMISEPRDKTRVEKPVNQIEYYGIDRNKTQGIQETENDIFDNARYEALSPDIVFNSESDAIEYFRTNDPNLTEQEFKTLTEEILKRYQSLQNPKTESELDRYLHDWDYWDGFVIRRKVKIFERLKPLDYLNDPNRKVTSANKYESIWKGLKNIREKYKVVGYSRWENDHWREWGVDENIWDYGMANEDMRVNVISEKELEIPLHSIHLFAYRPINGNSPIAMGNDLQKSLENQVKASGLFVGNPSLESSQNILIQNIGSKYSGAWYTKKVTHQFSQSSGYTCDIEFVQRDITMFRSVIKANINTKAYTADLNEQARKNIDSEAYKIPARAKAYAEKIMPELEAKYGKNAVSNIRIVQDNVEPSKFYIYTSAEEDTILSSFIATDDDFTQISLNKDDLSYSAMTPGVNPQ